MFNCKRAFSVRSSTYQLLLLQRGRYKSTREIFYSPFIVCVRLRVPKETPKNFPMKQQLLFSGTFMAAERTMTFFSGVNRVFLVLTLSSVTMKFTANTITGLDWAAKVHSHGSYVHFERAALCYKLNYFISLFPVVLDRR